MEMHIPSGPERVVLPCFIYADEWGRDHIATLQLAPDCGEDFCEYCGECLDCYPDEWCAPNGFSAYGGMPEFDEDGYVRD